MSQPPAGAKIDVGPATLTPSWVRWRIICLLMAFSFMNWFSRVCLSVADDPIMSEFQLTSPQIGAIDSALLLAYAICMTPGGWFIDRFGAKLALTIMGLGSALFMVLTGVGLPSHIALGTTAAFAALLLLRACMGALSAPIYPASAKLVASWMPLTRRAWANGLITGASPLGIATAH